MISLRRAGGGNAIMVDMTDDGIGESNKATPAALPRSEEWALGSSDRLDG